MFRIACAGLLLFAATAAAAEGVPRFDIEALCRAAPRLEPTDPNPYQSCVRDETEARNHAILRAVPDLMFLQDHEGRYLDYHAPDPKSLLLPPEQFIGRSMRDVLPDGIVGNIESAFTSVLKRQEPATVEYGIHIGDEERRFEARLVPHEHQRVLSIVRDVTDRYRAEMALRDAHADLVRVSKLAALGWEPNESSDEAVERATSALVQTYA